MPFQPDDLLGEAALEAAVAALAERNQHHLADMSEREQSDAVGHWRELAMTVLTAARTAAGPPPRDGETGGRAAIVLEDAGGDEITVHASFYPQLEDLGGGEVAAPPAQATAPERHEQLAGDDEDKPHDHADGAATAWASAGCAGPHALALQCAADEQPVEA